MIGIFSKNKFEITFGMDEGSRVRALVGALAARTLGVETPPPAVVALCCRIAASGLAREQLPCVPALATQFSRRKSVCVASLKKFATHMHE